MSIDDDDVEKCLYAFDAYLDASPDERKDVTAFSNVAPQFIDIHRILRDVWANNVIASALWHRLFSANVLHVEKYILIYVVPHIYIFPIHIKPFIIHNRIEYLKSALAKMTYTNLVACEWVVFAAETKRSACLRILIRDANIDVTTEMATLRIVHGTDAAQQVHVSVVRPFATFSWGQAMALGEELCTALGVSTTAYYVTQYEVNSVFHHCIRAGAPNDIIETILARKCFNTIQLQAAIAIAVAHNVQECIPLIRTYIEDAPTNGQL